MNQTNSTQKKNMLNYFYALLIGLLVLACAIAIAMVNANSQPLAEVASEEEKITVSVSTFTTPMKNYTISKDYSATELQFNETLKQWEIHKAIDFLAGDNLDVFAVGNGTVTNVYNNYLEGTVVEIAHSNGLVSVYKSLESSTVKVGDKVSAGQKIGIAGNSMAQELNSTSHLHFEMLKDGVKVDPNDYIDLAIK